MKISCDISILARRRYKGNPRHCPIMTESGSLGLKKLEVNNNGPVGELVDFAHKI